MSAIQPRGAQSRRPALKLVKTQDLGRDDWLAVRRTGIGGSDAAAAVGLNPYMSALELWLDKTGRGDGMPRPAPDDTTSPTYWGTLLEPIVAASYTKQTHENNFDEIRLSRAMCFAYDTARRMRQRCAIDQRHQGALHYQSVWLRLRLT